MRIAFVSDLDARDVKSFSGSTYRMWRGLEEAGAKIDLVTPLILPNPLLYRVKGKWRTIRGLTYSYKGEPRVLNTYARQAEAMISSL